jgi:hypothetical protein
MPKISEEVARAHLGERFSAAREQLQSWHSGQGGWFNFDGHDWHVVKEMAEVWMGRPTPKPGQAGCYETRYYFQIHGGDPDEAAIWLDESQLLRDAATIMHLSRSTISYSGLEYGRQLSDHVGPTAMSPSTLAYLMGTRPFSCEEYDAYRALMPEGGRCEPEIVATRGHFSLTFERNPKNGGYAEVAFVGVDALTFPVAVSVTRWADMDDDANHGDECDGENCECEPSIEHEATTTITEWNDAIREDLRQWIYDNVVT